MNSELISIPEALGISALGIVIVFALLAVLMGVIKLMSVLLSGKKAAPSVSAAASAPAANGPTAPGSAGTCELNGVEERTAALLMAVTADQMGVPINELRFRSIREIGKEEE